MPFKPVVHIYITPLFSTLRAWHKEFSFIPFCKYLVCLLHHININYSKSKQSLSAYFFSSLLSNNDEIPFAIHRLKLHLVENFSQSKNIMCADPVHLEVGINDITLTEQIKDLTDDEAKELIELLNQHFKQDEIEFIFGSNQSWYVVFPDDESVKTTPLDQMLNKNIDGYLVSSPQRNWRAIQNEVQMLLHTSTISQQRELAGLTAINSVWFWGAGQAQKPQQRVQRIYSEDAIQGQTFANAAGCEWQKLPENGEQILAEIKGDNILILDQLVHPSMKSDSELFQQELTAIDNTIIKPLLKAWQEDKIDIVLHDCTGNIIKPFKVPAWKFWIKPKSLIELSEILEAQGSK